MQDMHVARKHQNKQDETMVPITEEAHVHYLLIVLVLNSLFGRGLFSSSFDVGESREERRDSATS